MKETDLNFLRHKMLRCQQWSQDPDRSALGEIHSNMVHEQAAAIMLYTQETCLYHRLNAALRLHEPETLAPLAPYLKLLLSGNRNPKL